MAPKANTEKRLQILTAAVGVFAVRGFHHATVADVAAAAGCAPGTIYLYFSQKEDLLVALYERSFEAFLAEVRRAIVAEPPGVPRLQTLVRRHILHAREHPELARVLHLHAREIHPRLRRGIAATMKPYAELIEAVIQEGKDVGDFDPGLNPTVARRFLMGGLDDFVTASVLSSEGSTVEPLVDEACLLATRALCAPPAPPPVIGKRGAS